MKKFKKYNSIGKEELIAANKVLKSGKLSEYIAKNNKFFYGGKNIKILERKITRKFKVKNAILVNSWTSGLIAIFGALGIKKDDEVILPPWTMSACAASIIFWGGKPVFCDIEKETFCIDPEEIKKKITKKTKAILAVDIFGYPCDLKKINSIARKNKIFVVSDSAQSIGAKYYGKFAGTVADIGGFSLNYHKHINTGEGGIIVTNNHNIAKKCKLLINHAESFVEKSINKKHNLIGFNFRLTELQAAIGIEQLKKLDKIVKKKQKNADYLSKNLKNLKGLIPPIVDKKKFTHAYYMYPLRLDHKIIKTHKNEIFRMLMNEGIPVAKRYEDISKLPSILSLRNSYKKQFKIINLLNQKEYLGIKMWAFDFSINDLDYIISKFKKIWDKLDFKK
tara:strand:- start:303 stop:1481 length:1179 start_codon:yes stop_codon:yes gene_type:complete